MSESYLERIASALIKEAGLPEPIREFRFHPIRKWRADFVWIIPSEVKEMENKLGSYTTAHKKIILEVEGGTWMPMARHQSPKGISADMEKYNEASLMGWTIIRVTKFHMLNGQMILWLKRALDMVE